MPMDDTRSNIPGVIYFNIESITWDVTNVFVKLCQASMWGETNIVQNYLFRLGYMSVSVKSGHENVITLISTIRLAESDMWDWSTYPRCYARMLHTFDLETKHYGRWGGGGSAGSGHTYFETIIMFLSLSTFSLFLGLVSLSPWTWGNGVGLDEGWWFLLSFYWVESLCKSEWVGYDLTSFTGMASYVRTTNPIVCLDISL